jgi:hypothetical protein
MLQSRWDGAALVFYDGATDVFKIDSAGVTSLVKSTVPSAPIKGARFAVAFPNIVAASAGAPFFVAPAACKVVSARETHVTVCDAADTLTIEKCVAGKAPGAGDVVLAAAWAMNSTANTSVSKAAVTDGKETLAAGDALLLKIASGDGTNYAGGCVTVLMEWA